MMIRARISIRYVVTGVFGLLLLLTLLLLPGSVSRGQDITPIPTEEPPSPPTPIPPEPVTTVPTELPPPPNPPTATFTEPAPSTETPSPTEPPTTTETLLPTDTALPTMTETATVPTSLPTTAPSPSATPIPDGPVILLNETVEAETGLWTFGGTWNRSNIETAHTGTWAFSDSPGVAYSGDTVATLNLVQPLSLPTNAHVQLLYWQRLDLGPGDGGQVQFSTDNVNWTTVVSETAVRNLAWTARTVYLDLYAGQPLWLRFVLNTDSDPATVGDGWWLDDIMVTAQPVIPEQSVVNSVGSDKGPKS